MIAVAGWGKDVFSSVKSLPKDLYVMFTAPSVVRVSHTRFGNEDLC